MRALFTVAALAVAVAGCFQPNQPPCSFACGDNGKCPDDYTCLTDGYCHFKGLAAACGYSDAGAAADAGTPDLISAPDLFDNDGPGPAPEDLSVPDMAVTMPDMTVLPDLRPPVDLASTDLATFTAVAPCNQASDYVTSPTTITVVSAGSFSYSPSCLQVRAGDTVVFNVDFSVHPLRPGTLGTQPNPIYAINDTVDGGMQSVTFPVTGYYAFYCDIHGSTSGAGLSGVIQVIP